MDSMTNALDQMYARMGISEQVLALGRQAEESLRDRFDQIDAVAQYNQLKVLDAMHRLRVSESHFMTSTGYGYNDDGRDTLEEVYASVFGTEDALVRGQISCGTHALATALRGNLRPGDEILSPMGPPYDTLQGVIGIRPERGSLAEFGISYRQAELLPDGSFDYPAIRELINDRTRLVAIQRSKGYLTRPSYSVDQIGELIRFVKSIKPDLICMVDNCYGEFVELTEPSQVGADLCVGSLIKNPGGGLAASGGYITGKKEYVENAAFCLTTPGLGKEVGANFGINRSLYQGLFLAPQVTAAAVKSAVFAACLFEGLGFEVIPSSKEERHDIIQAVVLRSPQALTAFCRGIQAAAPVDSYLTPEPWPMPGYDCDVIMAAGAFISGASIELSADGPLRPPYTAYFQGGLTWDHGRYGILCALQAMADAGQIRI